MNATPQERARYQAELENAQRAWQAKCAAEEVRKKPKETNIQERAPKPAPIREVGKYDKDAFLETIQRLKKGV